MKRLRAFLPLLVLVAIGLALLASGALDHFDPHNVARDRTILREGLALHPLLGPLLQVVAMMLVIATGIPGGIVIVLAGGMLFGAALGTVLSSAGTLLGATILFFASRSAFSQGRQQAPALVERLRTGYHAYPFSYSLFLRLVPFFPFGGVTIALAALRCPLWLFLLATATGGSVMIAFETALGAGLTEVIAREGAVSLSLLTHRSILLPLLGMALLALAPIVIGRLRRGKGRQPG